MKIRIRNLSRLTAAMALISGAGAVVLHSSVTLAAGGGGPAPIVQTMVETGSLGARPVSSLANMSGPNVAVPRQAIVATTPAPAEASPEALVHPVSALGLPCGLSVDATTMPGAIVALDVMAPCQPNTPIIVEHSGLTLTMQTDSFGLLTVDIPAFQTPAFFDVTLPDGQVQTTLAAVPELADFNRVAIHWDGVGAFALHAMEFGAGFGDPGHVWEDAPGTVMAALEGSGGFFVALGDPDLERAPQAQVYSLHHGSLRDGDTVRLSVDAAITPETCGQHIEAKALQTRGGTPVENVSLSLTMPGCDAVGDFLVLQNLLQDLRLASN